VIPLKKKRKTRKKKWKTKLNNFGD
jgi:hypothetical protein